MFREVRVSLALKGFEYLNLERLPVLDPSN